jgi:hypothetical protein
MSYVLLKQEQEAQTLENLEPAAIYDIAKSRSKYRKQYIAYDNLERANKPQNSTAVTSVIGEKALKVVSVVAQKLKGERTEFIANSKYIAKITGKKRRQNINIINQINGTAFKITSYKKYKNQRNCYVFTHLENTAKIYNSKVQNIAQLESLQTALTSQLHGPYKNNNTKSIRSNVHTHESNFLQNLQGVRIEENITPEIVQFSEEPVKPANLKRRLPNERKKPTNTERKAKIYHFNQYKEPQGLSYHYPLTKEDASRLQSLSGRDFSLQAMNEILLDMSKRRDNRFCSKAQFMAYFGTCLKYEMRDAVKTGNDNFYIKANTTQTEQGEIIKAKQIEQYLANIEQQAITNVCPENQLKARIANVLEPLRSYELLSNIKDFAVVGGIVKIYLKADFQLSWFETDLILSQVKSIYSTPEVNIESVEYVVENVCKQINGQNEVWTKATVATQTLQQGIWGDICHKLIAIYGVHIYNNWFSKLSPVIDEQNRTIELKAPNSFIQEEITKRYGDIIIELVKNLDLKFIGISRTIF